MPDAGAHVVRCAQVSAMRAIACLLFLGASSIPTLASAQLRAELVAIGTRDAVTPPILISRAINLEECESNAPVTIRVSGIPTGASQLDLWLGQTCADAGTRSSATD